MAKYLAIEIVFLHFKVVYVHTDNVQERSQVRAAKGRFIILQMRFISHQKYIHTRKYLLPVVSHD